MKKGQVFVKKYPLFVVGLINAVIGFLIGFGYTKYVLIAIGLVLFFVISSVSPPAWVISHAYPLLHSVGQYPFYIGSITITIERIIVLFSIIGFAIIYLRRKRQFDSLPPSILSTLLVWFGAFLVSGLLHPSAEGWHTLLSLTQKIAFCWMVFIVFSDINKVRKAFRYYLIASLFASVVTIIVYIQMDSFVPIRSASFNTVGSVGSRLVNGLARAGTGDLMALWIAFIELKLSKSRRKKILWSFIILWLVGMAMVALRREYIIDILLGLFVISVYKPINMRRLGLVIGSISVVTIAIIVGTSTEWRHRLLVETQEAFQNSTDPRTNALRLSYYAVVSKPVFGYGPGSYRQVIKTFSDDFDVFLSKHKETISAHNTFALFAVEGGLVTLGGFMIFVVQIYKGILGTEQINKMQQPVLFTVHAFSMVIFVQLSLSMMFGSAIINNVYWFWVGILLAIGKISTKHMEQSKEV